MPAGARKRMESVSDILRRIRFAPVGFRARSDLVASLLNTKGFIRDEDSKYVQGFDCKVAQTHHDSCLGFKTTARVRRSGAHALRQRPFSGPLPSDHL